MVCAASGRLENRTRVVGVWQGNCSWGALQEQMAGPEVRPPALPSAFTPKAICEITYFFWQTGFLPLGVIGYAVESVL
jgi:hypothetical protein